MNQFLLDFRHFQCRYELLPTNYVKHDIFFANEGQFPDVEIAFVLCS
jgi:hypothetical protein